jgi:hypothetical protein
MLVLAASMLVLSTQQDWKDSGSQDVYPMETTGVMTFAGETPDIINLLKVSSEEEAEDAGPIPVAGCLTEEECAPIPETLEYRPSDGRQGEFDRFPF